MSECQVGRPSSDVEKLKPDKPKPAVQMVVKKTK